MGLAKLPFVLERFDVVCYEKSLGIKLCQVDSGEILLLTFHAVDPKGTPGEVEKHGRVQVGDALLSIDEVPIEFLSYEEILRNVRETDRPVTLTFGRTEASLANKVKERLLYASTKLKAQSEQARMKELEDERRSRKLKVTSSSSSSHNAHGTETERLTLANGRTLYTAKDFHASRFRRIRKLALGIAAMVCLVVVSYFVDFDLLGLTKSLKYSETGMEETFHADTRLQLENATVLETQQQGDDAAAGQGTESEDAGSTSKKVQKKKKKARSGVTTGSKSSKPKLRPSASGG